MHTLNTLVICEYRFGEVYQDQVLQNLVASYLQTCLRYGEVFFTGYLSLQTASWIGLSEYEKLLRYHLLWVPEDLHCLDRWLLALLTHAKPSFRTQNMNQIATFRSPLLVSHNQLKKIFDAIFGLDIIVPEILQAPLDTRGGLVETIISLGNSAMLEPLIHSGMDIDERYGSSIWCPVLPSPSNYLASAALNPQLEIFELLIDAGAKTSDALATFLIATRHPSMPQHITDQNYCYMLSTLLANCSPPSPEPEWYSDPLRNFLKNDRAFASCPEGANILTDYNLFQPEELFGSRSLRIHRSLLFNAIIYGRADVLERMLQRGPRVNEKLERVFNCYSNEIGAFTWLTLAIYFGRYSSLKKLVSGGADVSFPDGNGGTPIELSRKLCDSPHPRIINMRYFNEFDERDLHISEAEEKEILEYLESLVTPTEHRIQYLEPSKPSGWTLRSSISRTSQQLVRRFTCRITRFHRHWRKQLFYDPILRLGFAFSYATLFFIEIISILVWLNTIPKPPRATALSFAVGVTAAVWGLGLLFESSTTPSS